MKRFYLVIGVLVLFLMSGCLGAKSKIEQNYTYKKGDSFSFEIIDQANVPEEGMNIFKNRLTENLNKLGYGGSTPNKVLEITFTNYHLLNTAKRAMFGLFAGSDDIKSTVKIKDKSSGNVVGQIMVETVTGSIYSSSTSIIQGHADKITDYLKTGQIYE